MLPYSAKKFFRVFPSRFTGNPIDLRARSAQNPSQEIQGAEKIPQKNFRLAARQAQCYK
jgi:hypothetical protein